MLKRVVKFSATWCGPCKTYAPIFDRVSEEYSDKTVFHKIDVDSATGEDADLLDDLGIRNIPTTVFLDEKDNVIKKFVGSVSEKDLKEKIDEEIGQ